MPHRVWKHHCRVTDEERHERRPSCEDCHEMGEPGGWRYSMHEAMSVYQDLHGLKPMGRHRPMADQLFRGVTAPCERCSGAGLIDDAVGWLRCGLCKGRGRYFTAGHDRIAEIRRLILSEYPEAGAGSVYEQPPYHRGRGGSRP